MSFFFGVMLTCTWMGGGHMFDDQLINCDQQFVVVTCAHIFKEAFWLNFPIFFNNLLCHVLLFILHYLSYFRT